MNSVPQLTRIMHVDDARDIRDVVRLALETLGGFTIESCESGDAAVAKASAFGPELLLLDDMMPGMDGPATFRRLRQMPELKNTPVLFMTAQAMPEDIARLEALGAMAVIPKPFDPLTLADRVRMLWARGRAESGDPKADRP